MSGKTNERLNQRLMAEKNTVKVRFYRPGLGDCFLLAFNGENDEPRYMLIDFGVLQGTVNDKKTLADIAENILKVTGGQIDVLVVSHEHWDHFSGFIKASSVFRDITVKQVWLGWTEDPANPVANELRKKKDDYIKALRLTFKQIKGSNMELCENLEDRLKLYEETIGEAGDLRTEEDGGIMDTVRNMGTDAPRYFLPGGEPIEIPGVKDARVYVFGPPERRDLLERSRPKKGEVYLTDWQNNHLNSFSKSAIAMFGAKQSGAKQGKEDASDLQFPFDSSFRMTNEDLENPRNKVIKEFFDTHYFNKDSEWRAIDKTWLVTADELALKLEEHTNNTSLVLGIELAETGKVLLFPGDAQVGSWMSWNDLTWKVGEKEVKSEDLLGRTVLYKVGHHGSHNATLREKGLELMTSPELTAMIPVSREMAKKKRWDMPYEKLFNRLNALCKGRIIEADRGVPEEKSPVISTQEWERFKENVTEANPMYIDYVVK